MLLTGFCVHSGTVAPPAIKQAVNFPPPAVSCSARAGSLTPLASSEAPLCSSSQHGVPATPVLTLLARPAEPSSSLLGCCFLTSCSTCSFKETHWLCIHQHMHLFYLPAQVKLHLQPLKSSQVLGDNSSDLRQYSVSEGKKYSSPFSR